MPRGDFESYKIPFCNRKTCEHGTFLAVLFIYREEHIIKHKAYQVAIR
jgi:hypothetical protein